MDTSNLHETVLYASSSSSSNSSNSSDTCPSTNGTNCTTEKLKENDLDPYDSDDHVPFFADATLDINEARGIAMTPDISNNRLFGMNHNHKVMMEMVNQIPLPTISDQNDDHEVQNRIKMSQMTMAQHSHNQVTNVTFSAVTAIQNDTNHGEKHDYETKESKQQNDDMQRESSIITHAMHHHHPNQPMATITTTTTTTATSFSSIQNHAHRPKIPSRPRDKKWMTAYVISLPLVFFPFLLQAPDKSDDYDNSHRLELADFPLFICLILALFIGRIFYVSSRGEDGEDQRFLAGQILIVSNAASCVVLPLMTFTIYYLNVGVGMYVLTLIGLIGMTIREMYIFAKLYRSGYILTEGVNDSERAFFRMLVNTSLDVLSRSFRSHSFYRMVAFLLILQFTILLLLRKALEYSFLCRRWQIFWICVIIVIGYWSVAIVIRFLTYLSCGGITSWFAQQCVLVKEMEQMRRKQGGSSDDDDDDDDNANVKGFDLNAHRYFGGMKYDQDFDSIDSNGDFDGMGIENLRKSSPAFQTDLTVKAFVRSGTGVSLGSIIHCALTGGFARFLWFFNFTIHDYVSKSERYRTLNSMRVGEETESWISEARARSIAFVRNNHDLALCHVAAYYSSYTRAANDVMSLIEVSGECQHFQDF
jgi:hypothetical protein